MNPAWYLTARYLRARPGPALLLTLAFALVAALPWITHRLVQDFERASRARAEQTPLIVGAPGSRFDLTLSALYLKSADLKPITMELEERLAQRPDLLCVPIQVMHTARGAPLVAVAREYFEQRRLWPKTGRLPNWAGECCLGAKLAERLQLGVGDTLFTDRPELLDLAKPPALELDVCGVLASLNGPEDEAVLVDLQTAWVVDGLAHAHDAPGPDLPPGQVLARSENQVALSGAFLAAAHLDPSNRPSYHRHGGPELLPLTAVLVFPRTIKAGTLLETELNHGQEAQAVRPIAVIEELLGTVLRVRRLIDWIAAIGLLLTLGLAASVARLGIELRREESITLRRLGAGRHIAWRLHGLYWTAVLIAASLLCVALVFLADLVVSDPTRLL